MNFLPARAQARMHAQRHAKIPQGKFKKEHWALHQQETCSILWDTRRKLPDQPSLEANLTDRIRKTHKCMNVLEFGVCFLRPLLAIHKLNLQSYATLC